MRNRRTIVAGVAVALAVAEVALILFSWIWSAAFPSDAVRSLLSGEGLRWFFGHFSDALASSLLVDILLLGMAYGCLHRCGVLHYGGTYRERRALLMGGGLLAGAVVVILLLVVSPHAVLLSATGHLFPSPFASSLLPVLAFAVTTSSVLYGAVMERFRSVSLVYEALLDGLRRVLPCVLFYLLLMQLCASVHFVFGCNAQLIGMAEG